MRKLYCLDDTSLSGLLNFSPNLLEKISGFIDLAEQLIDDGESIMVPSSIESISIGNNLLFQDFYTFDFSQFDVQYGINKDLWLRLLVLRSRFENFHIPKALNASIYDKSGACVREKYLSHTAAIIFNKTEEADYFVLLCFGFNDTAGEYEIHINECSCKAVYALLTKDDLPNYTRWMIQKCQLSEDEFFSFWERAFPRLQKSDDLTFRRFEGTYESLRQEVIKHLSFLNDHFIQLWQQCNMYFPCFKRRAKSEYGIDFSNESHNTRKSAKKMKLREAIFSHKQASEPVICEIHTKISPTINRIHLHPPITEISGDKVLIGIFVDHLNT